MDIVDINKVLDDLELNEEEQHSKKNSDENRSTATKQQQQQQQHNDLYAPYKYGPTSATTITGPSTPTANRMTKTNFVKVSNVFNR